MKIKRTHLGWDGEPLRGREVRRMSGEVVQSATGTVEIKQGEAVNAKGHLLNAGFVDTDRMALDVMVEATGTPGFYRRERWELEQ